MEILAWYSKQSFWMMFSSPKEHFSFLWKGKKKKENSSCTVVALAHKTPNLSYTLFSSRNLLQVNKILSMKKGRKGCSSSVTVGIIMVWQSQFKSVYPRSIVSEITIDKEMFAQFGPEEENRYYTVTKNNVISGSQKKIVCQIFGGCWMVTEKMSISGIHLKAIALIDPMGDLLYFLNWWKLTVNFWSGAISIIFQICEPEGRKKYFKYLNENQACYLNRSCRKLATKLSQCGCRALILGSSYSPKLVLIYLQVKGSAWTSAFFHNYGESNSRNWEPIFRIKITLK